jgi:hypothetical protein
LVGRKKLFFIAHFLRSSRGWFSEDKNKFLFAQIKECAISSCTSGNDLPPWSFLPLKARPCDNGSSAR